LLIALTPVAFVATAILVHVLGLDPDTVLRELARLVDRGLFYERWGREIASRTGDEDVVDEDVDYLDHLIKLYRDMRVPLRELTDRCEHTWCQTLALQTLNRVDDIRDLLRVIRDALNQVRWRVRRRDRLSAHVPRYSDWRSGIVGYGYVAESVFRFGEVVRELTNRECIWVLNKLKRIEEYTFAELVNDVTACHHTLMDFLRFHLDPELQEVYRGVYSRYGSPELVELCRVWIDSTNALYRGGDGIYASDDYYNLRCVVWGNRAELRVGSTVGHATHAELYGSTVVVRYYDTDEEVHAGLTLVAERFGFMPAKHAESEYTEFRVPLDRARDFFAYVLPSATSMDLRLGNPDLYWGTWLFRTAREFRETYGRLVKERGHVGAEVEQYLTALRRVGLLRE
jgi:hypothetical protein